MSGSCSRQGWPVPGWWRLAGFWLATVSAGCLAEPHPGPLPAPPREEQALEAASTTPPHRAFADRIGAQLAASGVPGGAIGIVEDGALVFSTGLGMKRAGEEQPVGVDTVFRIASTTKSLTAALVMSLAEDGIVSLDAPVTRAFPELKLLPPFDPAGLTLRRLLSHTSGLPDHAELACAEGEGALAAWFADHPNLVLWSPPGRLWNYSNLGYSLAGLVAERAAGAPFRDLMEERILGPLGMDTATFDVDEVIARDDFAAAHPIAAPLDPTLARCALTEPPGYLYASVRDLGKLTEAMLAWGGPILQPGSILQMALPHASTQAPPDMFYGLGLLEIWAGGRLMVGHNGVIPGMYSAWLMVPETGFGVIVLVNGDGYDPMLAAFQAVEAFVGFRDVPPPDWSTPPSDWGRYVGFYDSGLPEGAFPPDLLGTLQVTLEEDQLYLTTLADGARFPLFQVARDAFVVPVGEAAFLVTFWRDRRGQAEYLATRAGTARRVPPLAAAPAVAARTRQKDVRGFAATSEHAFARLASEHPYERPPWLRRIGSQREARNR